MSTPNGFDPRWVEAINQVLEERESDVRITDICESLWNEYLGKMIDAIEARDIYWKLVDYAQPPTSRAGETSE